MDQDFIGNGFVFQIDFQTTRDVDGLSGNAHNSIRRFSGCLAIRWLYPWWKLKRLISWCWDRMVRRRCWQSDHGRSRDGRLLSLGGDSSFSGLLGFASWPTKARLDLLKPCSPTLGLGPLGLGSRAGLGAPADRH